MTRDELCKSVKNLFPEISKKADKEYIRLWGDFTDTEDYSYSWFETLANAINNEMNKGTSPKKYLNLFELISNAFESGSEEVKKCIDVAFVENLFWRTSGDLAKSYWKALPSNLKKLYVNFHSGSPL